MIPVQQFIFGSDFIHKTKSAHHYDFLALSRKIKQADLLEIAAWSARRGDCLATGEENEAENAATENCTQVGSWNFHPLPSGAYCISRTVNLPFLSRHDCFTHGLIVPPLLLLNYANNPILLIEHLEKLGFWQAGVEVLQQLILYYLEPGVQEKSKDFAYTEISGQKLPVLRTIFIDGNATPVRGEHLRRTGQALGVRHLMEILDGILENVTAIINGASRPLSLLKALFDLIPVNCRTEFSFCTRLRFTINRPFRIHFTGENHAEQRRIRQASKLHQVFVRENGDSESRRPLKNRWSMFMSMILQLKWEFKWNEMQILDPSPCEMEELPQLARTYFKQLGLHTHCGKASRVKETPYAVTHEKLADFHSATPPGQPDGMETLFQSYTDAIISAAAGNPLAVEQMGSLRKNILAGVPESSRKSVAEHLLEMGLETWNQQKQDSPVSSYRQIEKMADVLCTLVEDF